MGKEQLLQPRLDVDAEPPLERDHALGVPRSPAADRPHLACAGSRAGRARRRRGRSRPRACLETPFLPRPPSHVSARLLSCGTGAGTSFGARHRHRRDGGVPVAVPARGGRRRGVARDHGAPRLDDGRGPRARRRQRRDHVRPLGLPAGRGGLPDRPLEALLHGRGRTRTSKHHSARARRPPPDRGDAEEPASGVRERRDALRRAPARRRRPLDVDPLRRARHRAGRADAPSRSRSAGPRWGRSRRLGSPRPRPRRALRLEGNPKASASLAHASRARLAHFVGSARSAAGRGSWPSSERPRRCGSPTWPCTGWSASSAST